jgi:hypothetical protein
VNSITSSEKVGGCGESDSKSAHPLDEGSGPRVDWTGVGASATKQNEPATVTVTPTVRAESCSSAGRTYDINLTCLDEEVDEAETVDLFVTVPHVTHDED